MISNKPLHLATLSLVLVLGNGCGDDGADDTGADTGNATAGSETGAASTTTAGTTTSASADESTSEDSGGSEASGSETTEGPGEGVPTESDALLAWVEAGNYTGWAAEAAAHPSTGPHGVVRTFFSDALVASFADSNAEHPVGAASVKELYDDESNPIGWAVMVKVAEGTGDESWYWWEILGDSIGADGIGVGLCAGCHSDGGVDYVLTPPGDVSG